MWAYLWRLTYDIFPSLSDLFNIPIVCKLQYLVHHLKTLIHLWLFHLFSLLGIHLCLLLLDLCLTLPYQFLSRLYIITYINRTRVCSLLMERESCQEYKFKHKKCCEVQNLQNVVRMVENMEPCTHEGTEKEPISQGWLFEVLVILLQLEKLLEIYAIFLLKSRLLRLFILRLYT